MSRQPSLQIPLHARVYHQKRRVTHVHHERSRIARVAVPGSRSQRRFSHPRTRVSESKTTEVVWAVRFPHLVPIAVVIRARDDARVVIGVSGVMIAHIRRERTLKLGQVKRLHYLRVVNRVSRVFAHHDPGTSIEVVRHAAMAVPHASRVRHSGVIHVRVRPERPHRGDRHRHARERDGERAPDRHHRAPWTHIRWGVTRRRHRSRLSRLAGDDHAGARERSIATLFRWRPSLRRARRRTSAPAANRGARLCLPPTGC